MAAPASAGTWVGCGSPTHVPAPSAPAVASGLPLRPRVAEAGGRASWCQQPVPRGPGAAVGQLVPAGAVAWPYVQRLGARQHGPATAGHVPEAPRWLYVRASLPPVAARHGPAGPWPPRPGVVAAGRQGWPPRTPVAASPEPHGWPRPAACASRGARAGSLAWPQLPRPPACGSWALPWLPEALRQRQSHRATRPRRPGLRPVPAGGEALGSGTTPSGPARAHGGQACGLGQP